MRIANIRTGHEERAVLVLGDHVVDAATAALRAGWSEADAVRAASTLWLVGQAGGRLRELHGVVADAIDELRDAGAVEQLDFARLAPPITRPQKIVCIGLNYRSDDDQPSVPGHLRPLVVSRRSGAARTSPDQRRWSRRWGGRARCRNRSR